MSLKLLKLNTQYLAELLLRPYHFKENDQLLDLFGVQLILQVLQAFIESLHLKGGCVVFGGAALAGLH